MHALAGLVITAQADLQPCSSTEHYEGSRCCVCLSTVQLSTEQLSTEQLSTTSH